MQSYCITYIYAIFIVKVFFALASLTFFPRLRGGSTKDTFEFSISVNSHISSLSCIFLRIDDCGEKCNNATMKEQ